MTPPANVDAYLKDGCGRCEHYRTPRCKVHTWTQALAGLRAIALDAGLVEEVKWGSPCYTLEGRNVLMLVAMRERCAVNFFKGAALVDEDGVLESAGPNSRFVRQLVFRSNAEVLKRRAQIKRFVAQAIRLERDGVTVDAAPAREPIPEELAARLASNAKLRKAFDALTPGRRRSHVLHVSGAKQSDTRERRVDRCVPVILAGRGFNER